MTTQDDTLKPVGRDRVQTAILDAATELFAERSPATVSLREIARLAGVNYGLIHHYYGTKEAIVAEVFRRKSERGAVVIADAQDAQDAIGRIMGEHDRRGAYARMLAGALIEGATSDAFFRPSPAIARVVELIEEDWATHGDGGAPAHDARVVAAAAMTLVAGWGLFEPFFTAAANLDDRSPDDIADEMVSLARAMVKATRPSAA